MRNEGFNTNLSTLTVVYHYSQYSPMSLASIHDLLIVVVFHVVEQDLVEPGTRNRNGIMT